MSASVRLTKVKGERRRTGKSNIRKDLKIGCEVVNEVTWLTVGSSGELTVIASGSIKDGKYD
jgi:hypothetical protein